MCLTWVYFLPQVCPFKRSSVTIFLLIIFFFNQTLLGAWLAISKGFAYFPVLFTSKVRIFLVHEVVQSNELHKFVTPKTWRGMLPYAGDVYIYTYSILLGISIQGKERPAKLDLALPKLCACNTLRNRTPRWSYWRYLYTYEYFTTPWKSNNMQHSCYTHIDGLSLA